MPSIIAVQGDITTLPMDAIVNAASRSMRGGGGVDGAIHAAAGPQLLASCVERFPNGLATGDAGFTPGFDLPAKWIIHTVGPNRNANEIDLALLESCYRNAIKVADSLGAKSIAFPLVGAGVYGWDAKDSAAAALKVFQNTQSRVEDICLVGFSSSAMDAINAALHDFDLG